MKKYFILLMIFLACSIYSQEEKQFKNVITFSPQHLINKGIRLDYERKLTDNKWLVLAPQIYLSENSSNPEEYYDDRSDYNLLAGAGLTASMKHYSKPEKIFGTYLSYGLVYNFYYAEYYENVDNDVELVKANINKFGFDITVGYQFTFYDVAVIDIYTGLGMRKSSIDNGSYPNDKFRNYPLGFNMTGNLMLIGIKIGMAY